MKLNNRGLVILTALATAWVFTAVTMLHRVLFVLGENDPVTYDAWQLVVLTVTSFGITGYLWAMVLNPKRN